MPPVTRKMNIDIDEEFRKNPELTREIMDELRQFIKTQKHFPEISDEMLILFLHSCYYNMKHTKSCMDHYYALRKSSPEFFTNRNVTEQPLAHNVKSLFCCELPGADRDGNKMMYYSLSDFDPANYAMAEHMKVFLMTVDAMLAKHGTLAGFVVVFNLYGVKLGHITRFNLLGLRRFFQYLQDGIPIRLKKIHLINVMPFIDTFMTLFKPFMGKKFHDLLYFHTEGMDAFHELVPRKYLPEEAGGLLDSAALLTAEHMKILESFADFFLKEEKLRTELYKKEKEKKGKNSLNESNFSNFKKLEID